MYNLLMTNTASGNDGKGKFNLPASKLPQAEEVPQDDFRASLHWRVFRILSELISGWQFLADFKMTVTIFGSARFEEGSRWYEEARKLGLLLAKGGFSVVTGGGPGIMQAANQGSSEGSGDSIGLNIELPLEQRINPYVKRSIAFHYFFVRKLMLSYAARAYVFFPGGLGTLDETFEILTLMQTKKISNRIPVVLVGKDFWTPIHSWFHNEILGEYKAVDKEDLDLYKIVDTAEEAFQLVKDAPPREDFFY
ncbi:MAG: TIGR00730 family Rossman fold protein [Candidatus Yanofskybacteria bacterium]|nr:TIGR00730 family Rossman fold protein [Candidatus Yanofskybacteria bacterium]